MVKGSLSLEETTYEPGEKQQQGLRDTSVEFDVTATQVLEAALALSHIRQLHPFMTVTNDERPRNAENPDETKPPSPTREAEDAPDSPSSQFDKKRTSEERFYRAPGYRRKSDSRVSTPPIKSESEPKKSQKSNAGGKKKDEKTQTKCRTVEEKGGDRKRSSKKSRTPDKGEKGEEKSRSSHRRSPKVSDRSKSQLKERTRESRDETGAPSSLDKRETSGKAAPSPVLDKQDSKVNTPMSTRSTTNSGRRSEARKNSSGKNEEAKTHEIKETAKRHGEPAPGSDSLPPTQQQVEIQAAEVQQSEEYLHLLSSIELPPLPPEEPSEKVVEETRLLDQHRSYAQRYLMEAAGVRYPGRQRGEKVVLDQQVMQDYKSVFNYWEYQHHKNLGAQEEESSVITMVDGDLFSANCSMAHCVSEDFRMSSGIAVSFRRRFGHVAELLNQRKVSGEVAILQNGNRFIYYLVTKELYMSKPEGMFRMWQCLAAMKDHAITNDVKEIAMPKIGCGKDHMHWPDVANAIQTTFARSGIRITVYQMQADPVPAVGWAPLASLKRPAPFPPNLSTPPPAKRPNVDYWSPAPQEPNAVRTLIVQHLLNSNILDARPPIVRIFVGSCLSSPPEGSAAMLNATFKFWNEYLQKERKLGTNVPLFAGQINALVARNDPRDLIDYQALHRAAKDLAKMTGALGIQRLALQGFTLPNDKMVTFKIITILRLAMVNQSVTLNVNWPEEPPYVHLIRHHQQLYGSQEQSAQPALGPDEYDY